MIVSINLGAPNGGTGIQYFIGDFDGKQFIIDPLFEKKIENNHTFWLDYGKDNYAGVTWNNIRSENGGRYYIGWMSNWEYAQVVPTNSWRGTMTIPRQLNLIKTTESYRLCSLPVEQLACYRGKHVQKQNFIVDSDKIIITEGEIPLNRTEFIFEIAHLKDDVYMFELSNSLGDILQFGYDHCNKIFFVDRTKAGKTSFSQEFGEKTSIAPRTSLNCVLMARVILDKMSIELFFDQGETVMTEIFFLNSPFEAFSVNTKKLICNN